MRNYIALAGFAAALLTGGCTDALAPMDELGAAEDRWESFGPASYDLTITAVCECRLGGPVRVSVRDGVVVSRTYASTGQPVPVDISDQFPDVDGLFLKIRRLLEDGSSTVETEYDPLTGYPREIAIDREMIPVDGGIIYTITLATMP